MAGQKMYRQQCLSLRVLPPERVEQVFEDFASGRSLKRIIVELDVGLRPFYDWLHEKNEEGEAEGKRWALWQQCKTYRAVALSEEAVDIVDEANPMLPDGVRHAEARSKVRQWMAAINDPKTFGKQPDTVINIGQLHLTAVREINAEDTKRRLAEAKVKELPAAEPEPDYEIVHNVDDLL